jgi:hypothetical protein
VEFKGGNRFDRSISLALALSILAWLFDLGNCWHDPRAEADPGRRGKVNINSASKNELTKKVPGITAAKAKRIIEGRPYKSINDLVTKRVLTKRELSRVRDYISAQDP